MRTFLLIFSCLLLLAGCSAPAPAQPQTPSAPPAVPSEAPEAPPAVTPETTPAPSPAPQAGQVDIRGRVIQTRRNQQGEPPVGTVHVEGLIEGDTRYDKAVIHVGHETKLFLGRDGKPASFSFLHSGDLVEVTFKGPVAESYPVKAEAAKIVILEHIP